MSLYAGSPVVRCTFEIENRALDHRLRLRAPTGLDAQSAVAGGQFGVVERASLLIDPRRYPRETPVATAPAHRYVSAAAGSRGLAIFTPGFFEYELEPGGDLLVTVLRAIGELSRGRLPTRPGHAGWPVATPLAQCQGLDRFQLGIGPVTEEELKSGAALAELWEDLFLPLQAVWLRQASPLSLPRLDVRLDGERLVFSGLKPAEQGSDLVLRCYNPTGSPTAGAWLFDSAVRAAHRARADESELHEIRLGDGGRTVPFHAAAARGRHDRGVARLIRLALRMRDQPSLPCFPCPHNSSCCAYGVTLSDDEAAAIARGHGPATIYRTRWGEWRTRVRGGRCVFLRENVCTIHAEPYYPAVCRRLSLDRCRNRRALRVRPDDLSRSS